jgi:beta-phosphoglucomutase family hydrolase
MSAPRFPGPDLDAVIFDMDGVVTQTAVVHAAAWQQLFDTYLADRAARTGTLLRPFDIGDDYRRYIDGMPRYDGVRGFLRSRGITLAEGTPADPPNAETVCGLGNRKNGYFVERVAEDGVQPYPTTVALIRDLHARGIRTAIISASENATDVLTAAGVLGLFDVKVDGADSARLALAGKPDPAIFLEAARRLDVAPGRAVVVEDALAGVEAGRRGGFGLVVGVDRAGFRAELAERGADVVVADLGELLPDAPERGPVDA